MSGKAEGVAVVGGVGAEQAIRESACVWRDGVCTVRRSLHDAVVRVTKMPAGNLRSTRFLAATREHAALHCDAPPALDKSGDKNTPGSVHAPRTPTTALDVEIAYDGAIAHCKKMVELRERYPDSQAYADAVNAYVQADTAFRRTLMDYLPGRRSMSDLLNGEEPRG